MRLSPADDVAVSECAAPHLEHVRISADQRLARQLAGAVGRYRDQRTVVLGGLELAEVAVDAAARRVGDRGERRVRLIASTTWWVINVP